VLVWEVLTLLCHRHVGKGFLQLDDEYAEAVGDAAADDIDDENGQTDEPTPAVGANDLRYLRLYRCVLPTFGRPRAHYAHWLRCDLHRGNRRAKHRWPAFKIILRFVVPPLPPSSPHPMCLRQNKTSTFVLKTYYCVPKLCPVWSEVDFGNSLVFSSCIPTHEHMYKLLKHRSTLCVRYNFLPSV